MASGHRGGNHNDRATRVTPKARLKATDAGSAAVLASRNNAGKMGSRAPRMMRPLVKPSHGIDIGDGIACPKLAGGNRIERCLPILAAQAGQLSRAAGEVFDVPGG